MSAASDFYAEMAETALELLTEFGKSVTLSRVTGGSYDPITGATVEGSDASVTTTGLIKPYPSTMIDGTRILTGDRELVLSNEQTPLPTDKVIVGGEEWAIMDIKTIKPDGETPVVFFVQVRN